MELGGSGDGGGGGGGGGLGEDGLLVDLSKSPKFPHRPVSNLGEREGGREKRDMFLVTMNFES